MVNLARGNLIEAKTEALVNTVNCVGVMGKGIALQFKQAFPENFTAYADACKAGEVKLGRVFVVPLDRMAGPRFILNFPTKDHWRQRSRLADIRAGLESLIEEIRRREIRSVAIPPLGCGNGGLLWEDVRPLIEEAFQQLPDVEVQLYSPSGAPAPARMPVATPRPKWTRARALLVQLMELYRIPDYRLSLLEVQKLAYFLQAAGEPLRLTFKKHRYGPYAENLNHVLQLMEGHFIRGYGDRSGRAAIHLIPQAKQEAKAFLRGDREAIERLEKVGRLIEGFESPYGMELLATVHWVAEENPAARAAVEGAAEGVRHWSRQKRERFQPHHIRIAWQRLNEADWLDPAAASLHAAGRR